MKSSSELEPVQLDETSAKSVHDCTVGTEIGTAENETREPKDGTSVDAKEWLLKQRWRTGRDATAAVKAFAFRQGFAIKVVLKSNGGSSKAFKCTSDDCPVQFHFRKLVTHEWHVTKIQGDHSQNCTSQATMSALAVSKITAVQNAIKTRRNIRLKELVDIVQTETGAIPRDHIVRRGKQIVLDSMNNVASGPLPTPTMEETAVQLPILEDVPVPTPIIMEETTIRKPIMKDASVQTNMEEDTTVQTPTMENITVQTPTMMDTAVQTPTMEDDTGRTPTMEDTAVHAPTMEGASIQTPMEDTIVQTPIEDASVQTPMIEAVAVQESMVEATPIEASMTEDIALDTMALPSLELKSIQEVSKLPISKTGEGGNDASKRQRHCSICRSSTHNKRSCTQA